MEQLKITNMIIDDDFAVDEYVTAEFKYNHKTYSMTFKKADLEIINSWVFEDVTSFPAYVPEEVVESIRDEVTKRI
ncbi:hypothetical protein BAVI_09521 [Neobacillus vireti LMG 21834]|uniref:WYL domain-containing protein n=2 Tax=Neobacillus TaxID=2675232 RepID=A0AB94IPK5_9BACI|nr:hypothetical protein BAVI_09521 [Neobacillus vireti LMG 21834]KLT15717.1 hypothetical protein AA980_21030 [Neobacillus vireti]